MPKGKPTPAQAQLFLQLYDLRREAKLRQAREWFMSNYFADTPEEAQRLAPPGTPENAYGRMVISYWDQACALLNYGLLHEELFFETTNEFWFVWERLKPLAPLYRKHWGNPDMQKHLESAAVRYEKFIARRAPQFLNALRQWMQQQRAAKKS